MAVSKWEKDAIINVNQVCFAKPNKSNADNYKLNDEFYAAAETIGIFVNHLEQVICKANEGERQKDEKDNPDVIISQIKKEQGGENGGGNNKNSSHCWSVFFGFEVAFWAFGANWLAKNIFIVNEVQKKFYAQ